MLSKNNIKFINSLRRKKNRDKFGLFIAEGEKIVQEILQSSLKTDTLICSSAFLSAVESPVDFTTITLDKQEEFSKISTLKSPQAVMAIVKQPEYKYSIEKLQKKLILFLDRINDPGNLGTLLRIADWFGINDIFCSEQSVDVYNPKVVQATMGAVCRVKVHYVESKSFLQQCQKLDNFPIYGTLMKGENIYQSPLSNNGLIILGNESHGISEAITPYIDKKITIPPYPEHKRRSESLNISIAGGIVCAEFRRKS